MDARTLGRNNMAELDDIDIAELNAQALYAAARNLTHLSDSLWEIARHDAVAAAEMILERDNARRAARKFMGGGT